MREKPEVGQTLYSLNVGNAARRDPQKLTPVVVSAVGRKYFTVGEGNIAEQYHIDGWRQKTEFSVDSVLYATEQQWLEENEANQTYSKIKKLFDPWRNQGISIEKLRAVDAILFPQEEAAQ
jgi:hypothetical protein